MNNAEYLVHSVHMNRLSARREFCDVHSWHNDTRCRDAVEVLWCHSHLVWLVFEGSISTCACFHSENFCGLFLLGFFVALFRSGKREERWDWRPKGRSMIYKV